MSYLVASLLIGGCSTVTIRDFGTERIFAESRYELWGVTLPWAPQKGTRKLVAEPSYESSAAFFLWGLVGEAHVNVDQICGSNVPKQLQAQHTFVDSFLTILTLGIYAPRTVKVWCGPAQKAPATQKKGS